MSLLLASVTVESSLHQYLIIFRTVQPRFGDEGTKSDCVSSAVSCHHPGVVFRLPCRGSHLNLHVPSILRQPTELSDYGINDILIPEITETTGTPTESASEEDECGDDKDGTDDDKNGTDDDKVSTDESSSESAEEDNQSNQI
ncbi:uncharacterized protein LOC100679646 [Nasonia vitripennis]|uniref:Uncharacterized protein n=1 Tax=Nasonia vitripennis TaxID=7425 RepID=A0A7M7GBP4_NASVI|nr:uncharacterized protein LOC100679646 [Nasonia vitripennis]